MTLLQRIRGIWGSGPIQDVPKTEKALPEADMVSRPGPIYSLVYGSSGGEKWLGGIPGSGAPIYLDHTITRRNARNAMHESSAARAIVERGAETIADGGLRLELTPNIEVLGITQAEAEATARQVEARFSLWANDKKAHRGGHYSFNQAQQYYQLFRLRENDVFCRLFYDSDPGLQNPLQFDFVDPDFVAGDGTTATDGSYIDATQGLYGSVLATEGIKVDSRGREVAYAITHYDPAKDDWVETEIPAVGAKSGRRLMLHAFRREYPNQRRGYSPLAHAVQDFSSVTSFSSSVIQKAINNASFVGWVQPSDKEEAGNPFLGLLTDGGAGPSSVVQQFGANPIPAENASNVTDAAIEPVTSYQLPEATFRAPGSLFFSNLTRGSQLKFVENMAPADSYDRFVDAFVSHISASMHLPLEVVLMKFNQNYSASRATLLLFWRHAVRERLNMAVDFLNPILEAWWSEEIGAGRLLTPGWSDPRLRAAWLSGVWFGQPAPDIDPLKTSKARKENLEMGVTSVEREALEHNGSDASKNIERNMTLYELFTVDSPWKKNKGA